MASLLLPRPASAAGTFWSVFEHLEEAAQDDPAALRAMSTEQRQVFALGMLRQEVNSGGFDSYFRYTGGETAPIAREAAALLGPRWRALVDDACRRLGPVYPVDPGAREDAVDRADEEDPEAFGRLDAAFYALEADQPADTTLDAFIWEHGRAFFN